VPQFALITFIAPGSTALRWALDVYRGLEKAARAFEVAIVGGETSSTKGPATISVSDVGALAGFSKLGIGRTVATGGILLFATYPLIWLADVVTRQALGGSTSQQGIVELFSGSQTLKQRVLIIILAIAIAPLVEEFVFRFYLYGVVKRYLGRFAGLMVNSVLFAAVHAHIPSAAPLFVLGLCFTLAYEWSGSILVSMTMHALFNSFTLVALAFPDFFRQQ
jgi:membrane protease YdiL (CAAX protease family)